MRRTMCRIRNGALDGVESHPLQKRQRVVHPVWLVKEEWEGYGPHPPAAWHNDDQTESALNTEGTMYSTMTPFKAFAWTSAYVLACSAVFWSGFSHFVKAPYRHWFRRSFLPLLIRASILVCLSQLSQRFEQLIFRKHSEGPAARDGNRRHCHFYLWSGTGNSAWIIESL